ncbi:MAG: hypothetical protein WCD89_21905 [Anaerocolumna sp.]
MNIENVLLSLDIMWKGMLGIFAVILLITFFVIFIQWLEKKFPEKPSNNK